MCLHVAALIILPPQDLKPTDVLHKDYWTGDKTWPEGTSFDIFKFNPWRRTHRTDSNMKGRMHAM